MIRFESVAKRYGNGPEVLHDLSFALAPGDFRFITGASGSGKTTLLNLAALADTPSRGSIRLFDRDIGTLTRGDRARLRRRIGIVFQNGRLVDQLTIAENIALPLHIDRAPPRECRDNVAALLDWLGLGDKSGVRAEALSGTERLLTSLARAVVRGPDLLVADEPTGAGDPASARVLIEALEQMAQRGTTVLVATRDVAFAERFAHPRSHLTGGILAASGDAP